MKLRIAFWLILFVLHSCNGNEPERTKSTDEKQKEPTSPDSFSRISGNPGAAHHSASAPGDYSEMFAIDLNGDQITDTLRLLDFLSDSVSFRKINLHLAGHEPQVFFPNVAWSLIDTSFLNQNQNEIDSRKVFVKKFNTQTLLLLSGSLFGSGQRSDFSILNVRGGKITQVFDQKREHSEVGLPVQMGDLNADGVPEFVFRHIGEVLGSPPDGLKGHVETYCIFQVYSLTGQFTLNANLTRRYNEENYVFAGLKHDPGILVYRPADGSRPRAFKKEKTGNIRWLTP